MQTKIIKPILSILMFCFVLIVLGIFKGFSPTLTPTSTPTPKFYITGRGGLPPTPNDINNGYGNGGNIDINLSGKIFVNENNVTESEKQKIIAREIRNLNQGQIRYNPPKEMKVGESDIIEVLIIDSKTENLNKYPVKGTGKAIIEAIRVSSDMEAELTGSEFDIKAVSSKKEKLVTEITPASWQWEVTPKKAGLQHLTLTITANIKINNEKLPPYEYKVFDKDIKININPFYSIREFCQTNLQWLITTIIACFGGFPWLITNWKDIKLYFKKLFQRVRISLRRVKIKLVKQQFSKKPIKQKSRNSSSSNTASVSKQTNKP